MNTAAYEELFERVDRSDLADGEKELVLTAAEGAEALSAYLRGDQAPAGPPSEETADPVSPPPVAYLEEIAVEGFRGVGPRARLQLQPGPGLTLVVGRNGSGKSSFAEALEVLLTGTTWRWQQHTKVWQEGWRNLHVDGTATISTRLRRDGEATPLQLTRSWSADDALDAHQHPAVTGAVEGWEQLGWEPALERFRPILSYAELGTMFSERANRLYDALSAILGLEEFDAVQAVLRAERLEREKTTKREKEARAALAARLQTSDDPRASELSTLLAGRKPDADAVSALLEPARAEPVTGDLRALGGLELPEAETIDTRIRDLIDAHDALAALRSTDAARSDALASLLEQGLAVHAAHLAAEDPADCPLCGTPSALDAGWVIRAKAEAQHLRSQSAALSVAEADLRRSAAAVRQLFDPSATGALERAGEAGLELTDARAAWTMWVDLLAAGTASPPKLAEVAHAVQQALAEARGRAIDLGEQRASDWRPLAEAAAAWVVLARQAVADKQLVQTLKRAEAWMGEAMGALRRDRLAPVVTGARANWDLLRHESNVALGEIELRKQGAQRYTSFDVTIDGSEASALGVMSQGELSALAISIFLPRALLPGTPFGFVVVDDPVQSMDPAKVDGLARVLAETAEQRQVVVFTHDERLPEALRRLDLDARVIRVQRRARSRVELVAGRRPSDRYLGEARALSKGEHLPPEIINHVIPTFCRSAIEAACEEHIRRERIAAGITHAEVDAELDGMRTLNHRLLAVFGLSQAQGRELRTKLVNLGGEGAARVVERARSGAHQLIAGLDPEQLVRDTEQLVHRLERR